MALVSSVAFELVCRGFCRKIYQKHRNKVCLRTYKGFTIGEAFFWHVELDRLDRHLIFLGKCKRRIPYTNDLKILTNMVERGIHWQCVPIVTG